MQTAVHRIHFLERAEHLLVSTRQRTPWLEIKMCEESVSFTVLRTYLVVDLVAQHPACSFSGGWCKSPSASARWSKPDRMENSAPNNTGYEPNHANFFSYTDPEHTPINIPDSHQYFLCSGGVTKISTRRLTEF